MTFPIIFFVLLLIIGTSYALWNLTLRQSSTNTIETNCFKVEFSDQDAISIDNAYPISDEDAKMLTPYEFTITNICTSHASYQVNLEILDTTTLENLNFIKVMIDEEITNLKEKDIVTNTLDNATTSYKLKTGYLREGTSKTFELRLYLDEETPMEKDIMDKTFFSKITVITSFEKDLTNSISYEATSKNEEYQKEETFSIHLTSEKYDIVAISKDNFNWETLEIKGKDITIEQTLTKSGNNTLYVKDEADNIHEITINAKKIDDKKPTANMTVTKENYKTTIDASSSKDNETSIKNYYYSKDGIEFTKSEKSTYEFNDTYNYGMATTTLIDFDQNEVKKVYLKVEDSVGNMSDVKEYSVLGTDFAYDKTPDNNLRYIGKNPDNYVSFNNELWRIIGVMNNIDDGTGKKETRIKLIKSTPNTTNPNWTSSGWRINRLTTLNTSYLSQLSSTALSMIQNTLWNLGGSDAYQSDSLIPSMYYEIERGTKVYGSEPATYTGKVALMYPSDYGYATGGGTTKSRETCLASPFYTHWYLNEYSDCRNNDWLYVSSNFQITLTPYTNNAIGLFMIGTGGRVNSVYEKESTQNYSVTPVVYLSSNVKITSGNGTSSSPFILSLN